MNTLHLSSVFPSFLYLGPWGCPQVLSPSMWVRMALFGARRTERTDLAMRKFRQGEFEYMVFFHVFFSKFGSSGSSGSLYISKSLWVKSVDFSSIFPSFRVKSLGVRPFFGGPTGPARPGVHGAPGLLRRAPGGGERRRARGGGALAGGATGLMCQSGAMATAATAGK